MPRSLFDEGICLVDLYELFPDERPTCVAIPVRLVIFGSLPRLAWPGSLTKDQSPRFTRYSFAKGADVSGCA
jgi:hypothetical protein